MLPTDDWTDLELDRVQSGRVVLGEDDEQEDPLMQGFRDDVARVDSTTAGHEGREQ